MTSKNTPIFPNSVFIGFENMIDDLSRFSRLAANSYPPYNVVKQESGDVLIEVAVAGFTKEEISVEVEERSLIISGKHESRNRDFYHRGISTKDFVRGFRLSEHVRVGEAVIKDGILSVHLNYIEPKKPSSRKINIL